MGATSAIFRDPEKWEGHQFAIFRDPKHHTLGAVAAADMTQHVPPAPIEITSTSINIQSSTIHLSEAIKTMDFSLPSSYDTISDAKSAATDELTVTVNAPTGGGGARRPPRPSPAEVAPSNQP